MFWTWLWGLLGIVVSTPMTVCLAVLGKYVPSLAFFATLLGEEAELDQDMRFTSGSFRTIRTVPSRPSTPLSRNACVPRSSITSWFRPCHVPGATRRGASLMRATRLSSGESSVRSLTTWRDRGASIEVPRAVGRTCVRAGQWETGAVVRGCGRGGERHVRRPDPANAGTAPRPLELYTRESQGRRHADAARRPRGVSVSGDGNSVAPSSRGPPHRHATSSAGSGRGSPSCRSWSGAGERPAATRRPRASPESGRRTWPSRWPMQATRSWPGLLPRFLCRR
jgi:hypothetical protein